MLGAEVFCQRTCGLVEVRSAPALSSDFVVANLAVSYLREEGSTVLLVANTRLDDYTIACNKHSLRLSSPRLRFISVDTTSFEFSLTDSLVEAVSGSLEREKPVLLLLANVDTYCEGSPAALLELINRIYALLPAGSTLVYSHSGLSSLPLRHQLSIHLKPIGSSFGKKVTGVMSVPDCFFGTFKLDRSEKFDEYLAAKGVNWFVRKMIGLSSITKTVQPAADGTYNFYNKSSKSDLKYENVKLGQEFQNKGFDGFDHKITFDMDGPSTLTEKHIRLDGKTDSAETYFYTIENGELVLRMTNGQIEAKRFFKRVE